MTKKKKLRSASRPAAEIQSSRIFSWRIGLLMSAIGVITFICLSPSLKNEFTNWDDPVYVTNNPLVTNENVSLKEIFETPVSLNYHPLTILTLSWNFQKAGLKPRPYFLTNIWLHVLNSILVFVFIFLLTKGKWIAAAVTSLWFGIHPMHVESVSWVSERKDVLYVFFFLLAAISYLRYLEKKSVLIYLITLILFLASVLSKAMAVVFPLILLAIDYFKERKFGSKQLAEKIPFLLVALVFGIIAYRIQATDAIAETDTFTVIQRLMFASYGLVMYIVKLFVPLNLSAFYPYPNLQTNNLPPVFYLSPIIVFSCIGFAWWKLRHHRYFIFGLLFYFFAIVLVLQFISVGSAIMADRYSYLSYIGLFFIVGTLIDKTFDRESSWYKSSLARVLTLLFVFGYSGWFAWQTYERTQVWRTSETLWTDVINKYPNQVHVAYKNRGNYYGQNNRIDEAYADYTILMNLKTKDSEVFSNMGNILALKKKFNEAMESYNKALELDDQNFDGWINRGITFSVIGKYTEALNDFNRAASLRPNTPVVFSNRGLTYFNMGKYQEAIQDLTKYLSSQSNDGSAWYFRGVAYYRTNQFDEAKSDLQRAQQLGYKGDYKILNSMQ